MLWPCSHNNRGLVKRLIGSGLHFGMQCLQCGRWEAIKKKTLSVKELESAKLYDSDLRKRACEIISRECEERSKEKSRKWWEDYNAYLLTEKWKDKRRLVLARDNEICRACLIRQAQQVHHLTYERVFDEPLLDLVSVCIPCHERIHQTGEFYG